MERLIARFSLTRRGTDVKTEVLAGVTAFLSLAYVLIVIPTLFSRCGMDFGGVYLATALTAALATLALGLLADLPATVVPSVAINAWLGYGVILSEGSPWQTALGSVMAASLLLLALSLTPFPQMLLTAVPPSLKAAVRAGLGLFLAFLGLMQGRLIMASPTTIVTLGDLADPAAWLTALGLIATAALLALRIHGAIFLGLLFTEAAALLLGLLEAPEGIFFLPAWDSVLFRFSLSGLDARPDVILTLTFLMLFDTTGTLLALGRPMHTPAVENRWRGTLLAAAAGGLGGAFFGAGAASVPAESVTGAAAGGRSGLTAVVTAALFGLALFLLPIAKVIAAAPSITAPALILAGAYLLESVADIDWHEPVDALPAFFTILLMTFSFSVVNGIGAGIVLHVLLQLTTGEGRRVPPLLHGLALLFLLFFIRNAF
ncbi:MAG: NCS2 family permease [Schwartzia sp.]|nr:NCS2 family permease [Schwartzia sp. (in: firmicutes)]